MLFTCKSKILLLLALLVVAAAAPSTSFGEAPVEAVSGRVNPHVEDGDCTACHLIPVKELKGFFTAGAEKRKLRGDFVAVCLQCHGVGFGHGVGKKPELNREDLPLDNDGRITCAITCHNMHLKKSLTPQQGHYHLRLPSERLCVSCHDK